MYEQLVQPNLNITGEVGMCLKYAHEMFGAPGGVTWAWQAWQNAKDKHTDALPSNVAVPMWYSYKGTEGHVTVNVPGHGIYSSPYHVGTSHAVLGSVSDVERIYGVSYVGWSEDINGVRVVAPVAPTQPTAPTSNTPAADTGLIPHAGTATVTQGPLNVRTAPNLAAPVVAEYGVNSTFRYDSYIITNGYVWLSYISFSGTRHYVAEGPNNGVETDVWLKGGV